MCFFESQWQLFLSNSDISASVMKILLIVKLCFCDTLFIDSLINYASEIQM